MWPLHQRVPVRDKLKIRRRRTYLRSSASGVVSLITTVLSVLSGRRPSRRSMTKKEKQDQVATSTEIEKLSSRVEEDFAMFVVIPLGVRWGDMEL